MKRDGRSRRGMEAMLERGTVWRDRSVSPTVERGQYAAGSTLDRYQNHSKRRGNFSGIKVNESSSSNGRPKYRRREQLDNNRELSRSTMRMSPTSVKRGPMGNREYLGRELTKHYRGRDRLNAAERTRSKEIRFLHDEINRNIYRVQPSEYGGERMQNYHLQTESQLATDESAGKINNNLANWRIEDLLGGQSVLNADSIQNAQTWIANDNSLSPAQIIRARELLQELLITITAKPDVPVASGNVPTTMRQAIYIEERSFPEDRPPGFITDRRISDYTLSHNFSQQSMQSPVRSDAKIRGRELPAMHNSLPITVPLTIPTQNWRDDHLAVYSDSGEMPMTSRDIPKSPDFRCESQSDYPVMHAENPEFEKGNREHDPILLAPEKRKSHYRDHRRISRSRSRSLGKNCEVSVGERRVPIKSRNFINVGVNRQRKGFRRNNLSNEADHRHRRDNRNERSLCHSSPPTRAVRRHRR
ncbi:HTH-type transcriptional regulator RpiR [Dirofilaria immitis]